MSDTHTLTDRATDTLREHPYLNGTLLTQASTAAAGDDPYDFITS